MRSGSIVGILFCWGVVGLFEALFWLLRYIVLTYRCWGLWCLWYGWCGVVWEVGFVWVGFGFGFQVVVVFGVCS